MITAQVNGKHQICFEQSLDLKTMRYLHFLLDTIFSKTNFLSFLLQCNSKMVTITATLADQLFHICREEPGAGRLGKIQAEARPREYLISIHCKHFAVSWRWIVKHCVRCFVFVLTQQHALNPTIIYEAVCYYRVTDLQHL